MAAPGQRTSNINAALGIADVSTDTDIVGGAMAKLQKAYEAGVVNFNDLLDAATTKPKARQALMSQLEVGMQADATKVRDMSFAEKLRPKTEATAALKADIEAADAKYGVTVSRAKANAMTDAQAARIAEQTTEATDFGSANAATAEFAKGEQLKYGLQVFSVDPLGQRSALVDSLNKLGKYVPESASMTEIQNTTQKTIQEIQEQKLAYDLTMERSKGIAASAATNITKEIEIARQYRANPTIASAMVVQTQAGIIGRVLTQPVPTAASDKAAIFSFMKMLDSEGVVREGEYERARLASGVIEKYGLRQMLDRVSKGLLLTPEQRKDFLATSQIALEAHTSSAQVVRDNFVMQTKAWGLNSDTVAPPIEINMPKNVPQVTLGPDESYARRTDPKTGKVTEGVFKKNPDGTWSPKVGARGIGKSDDSLKPGDSKVTATDMYLRATVMDSFLMPPLK